MGHRLDFLDTIRSWLLPRLTWALTHINSLLGTELYAEVHTDHTEFVGYICLPEEPAERELHRIGFDRNPLAAWKRLESSGEEELASFAWRGHVHGDKFFKDPFSDKQLHVILYPNEADDEHTAVYAHWEYSWVTHPIKHYRAEDMNDEYGRDLCRRMFDEYDVPYHPAGTVS